MQEFKNLSQNEASAMLCTLIERSPFTSKELKRRVKKLEQYHRKNLYNQDIVEAIQRVKSERNSRLNGNGFGRDITNEISQPNSVHSVSSKKRKLNNNESNEVLSRIHFRNCVPSEHIWLKLITESLNFSLIMGMV